MTQPLMYNLIEAKRSTRRLYTEALVGRGDITQDEADQVIADYKARLETVFVETHVAQTTPVPSLDAGGVNGLDSPRAQSEDEHPEDPRAHDTAVSADRVARVGQAHADVPEGFTVHPKLKRVLDSRFKMSTEGSIDWGMAEAIAFASLVEEGIPVRLTGQDSRRGTFVHRHAVFHDRNNDDEWTPLRQISDDQAPFMIYDSPLSEYAVMGFEYGYSVERTDALVLWEAQFGDFADGAQTVMDEFISAGEQKWSQRSSLVLLLPHGYEGQGPDHSSARIERYLQMCAEENMRVINPTTGANYFHALRRQAYLRPRKPLIVFTPKQLLRLKAAAQPIEAFTHGQWQPVIPDAEVSSSDSVERVLLVSGRLYYDLLAHRNSAEDSKTAIVRVEQLYPLPAEEIAAELAKYPNATVRWVQDEPANMGPWPFMALNLLPGLSRDVTLVSRPASAAPSTGSHKRHDQELAQILDEAFKA
jgi:2-oxoglutarate dehydrogenase E1 component